MDRNTLSHYGWIVVLVLILACLLAFASPFGMFVADGIKSFTGGFVDTNNAAMDQIDPDAGKIPADQCSHENIELQNQKSASCAYNGYTGDKVCTDCGTKMETGTVTAKLDHTPVTDNAVPATCEQKGKTEGSHCSVCKTTLVAQTTTDALGHDWGEPFVAEEATCLGNGISRIECQREGCDAHTDSSIKAEGHAIVTVKGKAATCTATGLTNGEKCSVCGTVTKEQQVIPANGHTEVNDSAIQASCEVAGKTAGVHCSVCNTVIKARETVPALGHDMGNPLVTLTATCTSEGQTKTSCKRTGCGYYEVDTIEATGHSLVTDKAVAATCTATGLTEGTHCTQCSYRVSQTTIPALGHEYSDFYTVTEMTCTVDGVQRKDCERDGCDHYETLTTTAPGHKEVADKAVAPTCTATGLTAGTHCSVCNKVLTAQTVVPANGHTEVIDKAVSATCLDTGLTEGKHCSVCNTVLVAQTTVEALGHDIVKDNAVAATCTKTGLTEGEHCSRCDYKIAQTTTKALGHEYNSTVTKAATCTEDGVITYTCIRNDHSYTVTTSALGHTDIAPADNNCDRCGDIIKEVDGLGNVEVDNPDVEITYDPDTGDAGGIVPPSDDEEDEPFDIPEEELPETITVNYGKFESNTQYTPGQYATVEYVENIITVKQPVANDTYNMAWWHIVKDSDGNILSTTAERPLLSKMPNEYKGTEFSNYIVYSFDDTRKLEMNNVKSSTIWFAIIENSEDDTLDNAIYLAAVAQKQNGFDAHIAKWNGTQYVDQGKDTEIDAVNSFTITTPVTKTKQVLVSAPTSTTTYTYVPVGTLVAEAGMTWEAWLASDYNTTGETAPTIKTADFEDVSYDDVIVAGENYGFYQQTSEYTLSGVWTFVDVPDTDTATKMSQELSFTSLGVDFAAIGIGKYDGILYFTNKGETYYSWDAFMDEWAIDGCNTVDFGSEPQTVSKEFYEWFIVNATKQYQQTSEYTLSGVWTFVDVPDNTTKMVQELSFTSCGVDFAAIEIGNYEGILYFTNKSETYCSWNPFMNEWEIDGCNTVDFGTEPQTVSKEFYEWFIVNATKQ